MENRQHNRPHGIGVRGRRPLGDLTSQLNNHQASNSATVGGLKQVKTFFQSLTFCPRWMLFLETFRSLLSWSSIKGDPGEIGSLASLSPIIPLILLDHILAFILGWRTKHNVVGKLARLILKVGKTCLKKGASWAFSKPLENSSFFWLKSLQRKFFLVKTTFKWEKW